MTNESFISIEDPTGPIPQSKHNATAFQHLFRVLGITAIAVALFAPSWATAEYRYGSGGNRFDRPGFYLGGGLVGGFTTRLEGELTDQTGLDNIDVDPSFGLAARAGFRMTPRFAVEAHYEWMHDFETSVAGNEIAETSTSALTADLKGYLATGQIQPYLAIGAGFLTATSDDPQTSFQRTDTDFAARFGGGIDFYATENIGVTLDTSYVVPTGDVSDLDYVSVGAGVFFRF